MSTFDTYYQKLRNAIPINISDNVVEDYLVNSRVVHLKKNEVLETPGKVVTKLYFIIDGSFMRNVVTSDGDEKTVMFHSDSFFNFMAISDSYLKAEVTEYLIRSNQDSVILETEQDYVMRRLNGNFDFYKFYAYSLGELFLVSERFRNKRLALTSEEYLLWLYRDYPFLFETFPTNSIASFMGISREWLSKLKRKVLM